MTDREHDEGIRVLKWMLEQRYRARKRKIVLEKRLQNINREKSEEIGGPGYQPLPRSRQPEENTGAAGITFRMAEIEDRIYQQQEEVEKAIIQTMDILEYLPDGSVERDICEKRHIDNMAWREIEESIPMSHSQTYKHYAQALETLFKNPRVRKLIKDSTPTYRAWYSSRKFPQRNKSKRRQG